MELVYLLGFSSMTPLRNSRISHAPQMLLFDTIKNHGYNLEHNFGHGQSHLCEFLLSLNLLAFLFHTV